MEHKNRGLQVTDLLGVAPIARAVERLGESVIGGIESAIGKVCLPALEETGLWLRERVGLMRAANVAATVEKAKARLEQAAERGEHAPPRLIMESLNQASWAESEQVREMWAGLLVSSCSASGTDDSNWMFITLLGQLTPLQVQVLRIGCERAGKTIEGGLLLAENVRIGTDELKALTGCDDLHRLDREMDHLRSLGLLHPHGGFAVGPVANSETATLTPSSVGLHLYARAQGSRDDPAIYFGIAPAQNE
jgi:hypothetical protein